jgi:hypothetical protein
VDCQTTEPDTSGAQVASLDISALHLPGMHAVSPQVGGAMMAMAPVTVSYTKFTSQRELGNYLIDHYKIRKPNELASCEVCHR